MHQAQQTQQRSGWASTSGRGAEHALHGRRMMRAPAARAAAAESATTWPSGFAASSPPSPQLRFLDLERMRDVYQETVFPQHATSQASGKRNAALRQEIDACKDLAEVRGRGKGLA